MLGVLYALNEPQWQELMDTPQADRLDYVMDRLESELYDSEYCYDLDKAWEDLQYCLCVGTWCDGETVPANIVAGGERLFSGEDGAITAKDHTQVAAIVDYLQAHDLTDMIEQHYPKNSRHSPEEQTEIKADLRDMIQGLSDFYAQAKARDHQVIFSLAL